MNKEFKTEVINTIKQKLSDKEKGLAEAIKMVQDSSNNNSKSTAGDKHDTERAMAQLEIEKLQKQYAVLIEDIKQFNKSEKGGLSETVSLGSLVQLNHMFLFISCGLGKIDVDNKTVFSVSLEAPIAKQIIGKKIGDEILINNVKNKIISID